MQYIVVLQNYNRQIIYGLRFYKTHVSNGEENDRN